MACPCSFNDVTPFTIHIYKFYSNQIQFQNERDELERKTLELGSNVLNREKKKKSDGILVKEIEIERKKENVSIKGWHQNIRYYRYVYERCWLNNVTMLP